LARLDEGDVQIREYDLQWNPRESGPGPDVGDSYDVPGKRPKEQQTVQEEMLHDPRGVG